RNDAQADLGRWPPTEASLQGGGRSADVEADRVRVEEVANGQKSLQRLRPNTSPRSCGIRRSPRENSGAAPASSHRATGQPCASRLTWRGSRTTRSPSRCIATSSELNRNSFGSRTA